MSQLLKPLEVDNKSVPLSHKNEPIFYYTLEPGVFFNIITREAFHFDIIIENSNF